MQACDWVLLLSRTTLPPRSLFERVGADLLSQLSLFSPSLSLAHHSGVPSSSSALHAEQATTSRHAFLSQAAGSAAAAFLLLGNPPAALAAKYGGFGAGSPEVLNPDDAEIDQTILKSDAVQSALRKVRGYQSAVRGMQEALSKDSQTNVRSVIVKELDFASLRSSLNTVDTAFEEDTQRGTDRLIRAIMQDITELEIANQQKDGIPRSPRRVEIMQGKLAKLDQAFSDFLAFAK